MTKFEHKPPRGCISDKSSAVAEMGDRLATTDMVEKRGGAAVPLSVGVLGTI